MVATAGPAHHVGMDLDAPATAPPPPPPPPPHRRPLRRDRANGMLGGVAAGIAETYRVDVTLVRVLWVIAAIVWIGVPAYVIAWIVIPPADGPSGAPPAPRDGRMIAGLVLVAIGVLIATNRVLPHDFRFDRFGAPVLLIGGGLAILAFRRRPDDSGPERALPDDAIGEGATESAGATVASAATATAAAATARAAEHPTAEHPTAELQTAGHPAAGSPPRPGLVPPSAWTQTAPWPAPPSARALRREARSRRRAARPRPFLTPITLGVLLVGAGVASLLQATNALDVNVTVVLAIGTCIVGVALAVSAFAGRAYALVLVGILLAGATAVSSTIDVSLRGGVGHRVYDPVSAAALQDRYELGVGQLELDLRGIAFPAGRTRVEGRLGLGELLVDVPSTVRVEIDGHAGAGSVMIFGHDTGGWPADDTRAIDGSGRGVLQLDLRVGAGQVRVRRFEPGGIETIVGGN
jgi:phage shock protein PspC (stress-responsive transcriptional regulator)